MKFSDILNSNDEIIIFGASAVGKVMLDCLEILEKSPSCFCDNDEKKRSKLFYSYNVISFEELKLKPKNTAIIIAAGRWYDTIYSSLKKSGFTRLFSDDDVLKTINFLEIPDYKLSKIIWYIAKKGKLEQRVRKKFSFLEKLTFSVPDLRKAQRRVWRRGDGTPVFELDKGRRKKKFIFSTASQVMQLQNDYLHLERLNVVVTSRCTLNCKHCSSLMPFYSKPQDFNSEKIIKSLDKILSVCDLIYHVEVLGGEPFLYKEILKIIDYLVASKKVLHIDIVTNATILPEEKVINGLKNDIISVVIDDYGKLSFKINELETCLKKAEVDYRINNHFAWSDLGNFDNRNQSKENLIKLFKNCNFNSCTELLEEKLYRCPRSSHGTNLNLIPDCKTDYVDLCYENRDNSTELKQKIRNFLGFEYINACNYCSGNSKSTLSLPVARQQLKRSGGDGKIKPVLKRNN